MCQVYAKVVSSILTGTKLFFRGGFPVFFFFVAGWLTKWKMILADIALPALL